MNIYKLYAIIGPWTTLAPAAIALAAKLYGELLPRGWLAAWSVAIFSLVALEVVGALSTKEMIYSTGKKEWAWFSVAFIGVLVYTGLGVYALWGLSAWIYVVLAVFVHIAVTRSQQHQEVRQVVVQDKELFLKEKELELQREKERTKQIQAEARKARTTQNVTVASPSVTSPTLNDLSFKSDARAIYDADPDVTAADIARQLDATPKLRTVQRWVKEWRNE